MELALITAQQVAVLFLLIGTGMVAVKTGVLKLENKQALSNLLVYIIVPAMVVNSYRMEFSAQILRNLLAAFGMSVLSVLLGTVITLLLTARKTGSRMPIFRFACIFSNAGEGVRRGTGLRARRLRHGRARRGLSHGEPRHQGANQRTRRGRQPEPGTRHTHQKRHELQPGAAGVAAPREALGKGASESTHPSGGPQGPVGVMGLPI